MIVSSMRPPAPGEAVQLCCGFLAQGFVRVDARLHKYGCQAVLFLGVFTLNIYIYIFTLNIKIEIKYKVF